MTVTRSIALATAFAMLGALAGCEDAANAPFDHAKLMVVDGAWCFIGSANWDPRSLRLNFELNVECYGQELARSVTRAVDERIEKAKPHTNVVGWRRVRNALVGLLQPYL